MLRSVIGLASRCLVNSNVQPLLSIAPTAIQRFAAVTQPLGTLSRQFSAFNLLQPLHRIQYSQPALEKGIWIRGTAGRNKRIWRKSFSRLRRIQNHVFCSASQSTMLDKMVTRFWKKPKYWVDDPYEPYHEREEFHMTRKRPLPAHNPSEQ